MTFLRKKALQISSCVTRLAAPSCKEWAKGLECEVEFIEGDWRALAWAIGSARVLLDRRDVPLASLAEVHRVAKGYRASFEPKFKSASCYFLWALGTVFLWFFLPTRTGFVGLMSGMERVGGCLIGASTLYYGHRAMVYRRRNMDQLADAYGWAAYYRAELQKDLDFVTGNSSWLNNSTLTLGLCLFYGGILIQFHGWLQIAMAISYMPSLLTLGSVFYVARRGLKYKIGNLDALMATGVEEAGA